MGGISICDFCQHKLVYFPDPDRCIIFKKLLPVLAVFKVGLICFVSCLGEILFQKGDG